MLRLLLPVLILLKLGTEPRFFWPSDGPPPRDLPETVTGVYPTGGGLSRLVSFHRADTSAPAPLFYIWGSLDAPTDAPAPGGAPEPAMLFPGDTLTIPWSSRPVQLFATGREVDDSALDQDIYVKIRDYRLWIADGDCRQSLFRSHLYVDAGLSQSRPEWIVQCNIRWLGDLDGDRQPDLVLETRDSPMGCRVALWLSSQANAGSLVGEAAHYSGCQKN